VSMVDTPDFYSLFDKKARDPHHVLDNVTELDPKRASAYARKAFISECENVAAADEGQRNATLNTAAFSLGQLVAAGHLDEADVRSGLSEAARSCGLEDLETTLTITSGLTSGMQVPRVIPEQPPLPVTVIEVPDLTVEQDSEFWTSRSTLAHLHIFARARRVSPWAVLGVSLARIITATPFTVSLPPVIGGQSSLNLFVGLVGPSGSGKGAAEAVARDAITLGGPIEVHKTGSGEGIAHGYRMRVRGEVEWRDDHHAVLFSVPEIDAMAAQSDRRGATLMPELRSGWSGEPLGFGYADPSRRLPVPAHEYRMCLVAGIQPLRAGCLLNDSDGGTPQRFLWMPATDAEAPDIAPEEPRPLRWTAPELAPIRNLSGGNFVKVCQQARTAIDDARLARLRGQGEALDGHALLCRLKTAAALGILEGRYEVTDDDWRLAGVIQAKSDAVRSHIAVGLQQQVQDRNHAQGEAEAYRAVHVAEKVADVAVKRVCGVIVRRLRRVDSASLRDLRVALAGRDRQHLESAVEKLTEAGQIEQIEGPQSAHFRIKEGL
jgi:hypothetical protein